MGKNLCELIHDFIRPYQEIMQQVHVSMRTEEIYEIAHDLEYDLMAKLEQDPVSRSQEMVFCSNAFRAIMAYRIAACVHAKAALLKHDPYELVAYKISEDSAVATAIEISPAAKIGRHFVIDHGINTLIGATTEIGDNCTILQNVVLGARRITRNEGIKRHPTIGNHVQIASGVHILGPVKVGDHVLIGPGCQIIHDVPPHSKVKLMKTLQVVEKRQYPTL